jgi:hypothetical protein
MVDHPVRLRGLGVPGTVDGPMIIERTDQDFVAAVLDELEDPDGLAIVASTLARTRGSDSALKLFQPVQQTFNLALLEVVCDTFGQPRLDPARIESAGLVVRRLATDRQGRVLTPEQHEGWRQGPPVDRQGRAVFRSGQDGGPQRGTSMRGWVRFSTPLEGDEDPDSQRRRLELKAGHAELDRRLARLSGPTEALSEDVAPLFVAPVEVSRAIGKTVLYGLIPVTSSELSEAAVEIGYSPDEVKALLPTYLRAASHTKGVPRAGKTLGPGALDNLDLNQRDDRLLRDYADMLRLLVFVLDAFGDSPGSKALLASLNGIMLPYDVVLPSGSVKREPRPAGVELKKAADVLVNQVPGGGVTMPSQWPTVTQAQAEGVASSAKAVLDARLADVRPREGRFGALNRQYRVRAFVRVTPLDGCPPEVVWSDYSEPFTIAPWYESGALPPVQIQLPNALDRDVLKSLKPNVAFVLPESLFNFLQGLNAKDALAGKLPSQGGGGTGLGWICSFSIPIITFCAFIMLNIFLTLLDIVFFWMFFIKICLPFPRRTD